MPDHEGIVIHKCVSSFTFLACVVTYYLVFAVLTTSNDGSALILKVQDRRDIANPVGGISGKDIEDISTHDWTRGMKMITNTTILGCKSGFSNAARGLSEATWIFCQIQLIRFASWDSTCSGLFNNHGSGKRQRFRVTFFEIILRPRNSRVDYNNESSVGLGIHDANPDSDSRRI